MVLTSSICFTPIALLFGLGLLSPVAVSGELGTALSPFGSKLALFALLALSTFLSRNLSCRSDAPEVILVLILKLAEELLLLVGVLREEAETGDSGRGEGRLLLPATLWSSIT